MPHLFTETCTLLVQSLSISVLAPNGLIIKVAGEGRIKCTVLVCIIECSVPLRFQCPSILRPWRWENLWLGASQYCCSSRSNHGLQRMETGGWERLLQRKLVRVCFVVSAQILLRETHILLFFFRLLREGMSSFGSFMEYYSSRYGWKLYSDGLRVWSPPLALALPSVLRLDLYRALFILSYEPFDQEEGCQHPQATWTLIMICIAVGLLQHFKVELGMFCGSIDVALLVARPWVRSI